MGRVGRGEEMGVGEWVGTFYKILYTASPAKWRSNMVSFDVVHFTNRDLPTETQDLSTNS